MPLPPLQVLVASVRNFYETPQFHRQNYVAFNAITLRDYIAKHPDKSTLHAFETMYNDLRKL